MPISLGIRGTGQQFLLNVERNSSRMDRAIERLSTGKRINRPSDDPAGFVAAEELRGELAQLRSKLRTIAGERQQSHIRQSKLANVQTALTSLRDQVLDAAGGFLTAEERVAWRTEIDETIDAVHRMVEQTENAGVADLARHAAAAVLDGEASASDLASATNGVAQDRARLSAHEHTQLDTFERLYQDQVIIHTQALSQIEDADIAVEAAAMVQSQILVQGAIAALSYENRQRIDQITHLLDETA